MERYTVGVYVTSFGSIQVEANSEEEALDQVREMDNAHGIADTGDEDISYEIQ